MVIVMGITKSKNIYLKTSSGFTLVETLIYIAIIGMVVSAFVMFAFSILSTRNKTYVSQEVQANVRTALGIIDRTIKSSVGINIASSTFGSDPGELYVVVDDITKNPTVFSLSEDDGILRITESTSSPMIIPITGDEVKVTNLVFTNLTGSSTRKNIGVDMTVEYDNESNDPEFDYSQSIRTAISARQ